MTQSSISAPRVGVMDTKAWDGVVNLTDEADPLFVYEWDTLWTIRFDSDAHFVTYYPKGSGQTKWPRCNKPVLPRLREVGADLVTRMLVMDFDNPHHREWTEEALCDFFCRLDAAAGRRTVCGQWTLLYTTKHGARLVYLLDQEVKVDVAEGHHRWLCQQLREEGINIDDIDEYGVNSAGETRGQFPTSDWTRLFRLPSVTRSGTQSWDSPFFVLEEQADQVLLVEDLGIIEGKIRGRKATFNERDDPKPDLDHALSLMYKVNEVTGRRVFSDFRNGAKRRLKNRDCYPCLFEHEPLASVGSRDETMLRFVGEAVTLLYRMEKDGKRLTSPEHVFGIFLDPVMQLEPDEGTSDWTDALWRHVLYCWAREEAEAIQVAEEQQAREESALDLLDRIVNGMKRWCKNPKLTGDKGVAREFAYNHMIASVDGTHYPIRPDGWYCPMGIRSSLLISRIRALGIEPLMPAVRVSDDGKRERAVKAQELIDNHSTPVAKVLGVPGIHPGARILRIGTSRATLETPLFRRRTDLTPTFDPRVHAWLKALFGPYYEQAENWLAWMPAVEQGPICAMSLRGAPSVGKKLLVQGSAECIDTEHACSGEELVSSFQHGLFNTPIVSIDEGLPRSSGGMHAADMFRILVGGGRRSVNLKHKAPVDVIIPARILITTNGPDVLRMICNTRNLSPEDQEALAIRILHFDVGDEAAKHLRRMGGIKHTEGWIVGDGGQPSNYVIAKHFLWLYENKRKPRDKRLLVEGNGHRILMTEMRVRGGSAPFVIETMIRMIEGNARKPDGFAIEDGKVYFLTNAILTFFRSHLARSCSETLTANKIGDVLKGLVIQTTQPKRLKSKNNMGKKRWHEVDLRLLQKVARDDGWPCARLDSLISEQIRRGILPKEEL